MVELKKKGHTSIIKEGEKTIVRLYNTNVVMFDNERICLDTGGFNTATTRQRMNQAAREFNLNYSVFQKVGKMYAQYKGQAIPFISDMLVIAR